MPIGKMAHVADATQWSPCVPLLPGDNRDAAAIRGQRTPASNRLCTKTQDNACLSRWMRSLNIEGHRHSTPRIWVLGRCTGAGQRTFFYWMTVFFFWARWVFRVCVAVSPMFRCVCKAFHMLVANLLFRGEWPANVTQRPDLQPLVGGVLFKENFNGGS